MENPLIFVGIAPNRKGSVALGGASGGFLAKLAGMSVDAFHRETQRVNVLDAYPGDDVTPKARDLTRAACGKVDDLRREKPRLVVLCGASVAGAFGVTIGFFREQDVSLTPDPEPPHRAVGMRVAVIPHPSGRNRMWNDPEWRRRGEVFMRGLFDTPGRLDLRAREEAAG